VSNRLIAGVDTGVGCSVEKGGRVFENAPLSAALPAADLERAKRWYSEKLGLEPVDEDEFGGAHYETGGVHFMVFLTPNAGTNQATAAGFSVDNFDEVVDELRGRGVVFEDVDFGEMGKTIDGVISAPDGSMKSAWFKDSEGNILALSTQPQG
jgi:catechol 2,3-dioxygenase-like lactoylglutathione lyase family enzyme